MADPQKTWLKKLAHLNPNIRRDRGEGNGRYAPHKPLLLLALVDAAEAGELTSRTTVLTPGLRVRFNAYWPIVLNRWGTKPDPTMPFHYLSSQGFWQARTGQGTPSEAVHSTRAIELHPDFFLLLQQPTFRELARRVLVTTWFPPAEQIALKTSLGLAADDVAATLVAEEARAPYETQGRDARFRIQVIVQYQYTCALSGYALTTQAGASIVQAAHIAAFADTRNNDPRNGLALTPDAHWSFDEGLWTIDDDLRIVVARDAFSECGSDGGSLRVRHGRPLHFSRGVNLRPHRDYLDWHRTKRFVG